MTNTGMFVITLLAVAWGWLVFLQNRNHQRTIRTLREAVLAARTVRLREQSATDENYEALLRGLGVTDRWFRHAWPLTQLCLMWSGPPGVLRTAIPDALRRMSGSLAEQTAGNFTCGSMQRLPATSLQWHLVTRVTAAGRSFFVESYDGDKTPPGLWHREFAQLDVPAEHERVAVLLQGTRHSHTEMLSSFLTVIADRLEKGENACGSHEDDCGWAFRSFPAVTPVINRSVSRD